MDKQNEHPIHTAELGKYEVCIFPMSERTRING